MNPVNDPQRGTQASGQAKSRPLYIFLGILFGVLGVHNFYSGHYGKGSIKLMAVILTFIADALLGFYTGFMIIAVMLVGLWTLVELVFTNTDANRMKMR